LIVERKRMNLYIIKGKGNSSTSSVSMKILFRSFWLLICHSTPFFWSFINQTLWSMKRFATHLISYCLNFKCFQRVEYNLEIWDNRKNNYKIEDKILRKLLQQNIGKNGSDNEIHLLLNLFLRERKNFFNNFRIVRLFTSVNKK
jgi:hypothetical protein